VRRDVLFSLVCARELELTLFALRSPTGMMKSVALPLDHAPPCSSLTLSLLPLPLPLHRSSLPSCLPPSLSSSLPSLLFAFSSHARSNWWFRVVIHRSTNESGETVLRFEHPTMPGLQPGGWMQRLKDEGLDPSAPSFSATSSTKVESGAALVAPAAVALRPPSVMVKPGVDRKITLAELQAHNTESEPWFVVEGQVYDGAPFLKDHPGGAESITIVAGEDATEDFLAVHSTDARKRLADFHIGTLVVDEAPAPVDLGPSSLAVAAAAPPDSTFLSKTKWKGAKLVSIDYVNHDSRIYRFALEHPQQPLGLPVGQHVFARLRRKAGRAGEGAPSVVAPVEGELVQRAYTPVSRQGAEGFLDLLIKVRRLVLHPPARALVPG